MRICFYSKDAQVVDLASSLEGLEVNVGSSREEVESCVNSGEEKVLLFIDLDADPEEAHLINRLLFEDQSVIRLMITNSVSLKDLKKHQASEESAFGYIKKPLTGELVASLVNDFEMADYVEENNLMNEGDKALDDVDLTFVGFKKPENLASVTSVEDDETKENVLPFEQMDIPKEESEEESEEEAQTQYSPEEIKILQKHGVLNEGWKSTYESESNDKIQAKFDRVFRNSAGGALPDYEIEEPFETFSADEQDDPAAVEEVAAISLDFDNDQETTYATSAVSDEDYLENSASQRINLGSLNESEEDEDTGEFDVAAMSDPPQTSEEIMANHDDDDDDILEFNIPDGNEDSAEDDSEELEFGAENIESEDSIEDEESIEDDELDFSAEDMDEEESTDMDLSSGGDGDLDLGDDDMDLDLTGEEITSASTDMDLGDDLDLDAMEVSSNELDIPSDELDLGDEEETSEVETLQSSKEEEEATGEFEFSDEEDDDNENEATVATMLFSQDDPSFENLKASQTEDALVDTIADIVSSDEEVNLADLIEEDDDEEEEVGFSLDEDEDANEEDIGFSLDEEGDDSLTETVMTDGESLEEEKTQLTQVLRPAAGISDFSPADEGEETIEITPPEKRVASAYNEDEMMRLQATIRQLREERDELLGEITELKTDKKLIEQENLGLKAEYDEVKIELTIVKKRHQNEMEEMNYRTRLAEEKKAISEEKSRQMQKEFDRLNQKVRIDFNQVKQREKELESQLELVTMDSESQVRSRDLKILELKRKIDQLEFNMENSHIKESKAREDKVKVEDKLAKIMKTLRGSIQVLEDDLELDEELIEKIKKV